MQHRSHLIGRHASPQDAKLEIVLPEKYSTKPFVDSIEWHCRPFYYAAIDSDNRSPSIDSGSRASDAQRSACAAEELDGWLDYCLHAYPSLRAPLCSVADEKMGVHTKIALGTLVLLCCVSCTAVLSVRASRRYLRPSRGNPSFGMGELKEISMANEQHNGQGVEQSSSFLLTEAAVAAMSHRLDSGALRLVETKDGVTVR
jgi:hypothetical protein